jgi:exosortase D (VPLPA-CTERM-specific)
MDGTIELAPPAAEQTQEVTPRSLPWAALLLALLLVWLYHSILYRLAVQWWGDPNFSHGFFVPAFFLFVLWQSRNQLKKVKIKPSWTGLPIIVLALIMLVLGELGVELFTSRSSFIILLAGLIVLFQGWPMFRAVLFPWAFLFLMVPLPTIVLQHFTFPLQIFASKLATLSLQTVGVPALREGNQIYLPHITLEVAQACSGIRSLISLLTLSIMYGYLTEDRNWVRVLLACASVPIAVVANVFRIFITGLVGQWDPDKAQGFYHEFQGWLVFVVALALLFTLHRVINAIWQPAPVPSLPRQPLSNNIAASPAPIPLWSARLLTAAALMLITGVGLAQRPPQVVPQPGPLSQLPLQLGNWVGTDDPIDDETREILGPGEFLQREYDDSAQRQPSIGLFVAYFPTQEMGDTIHSPNHCLPGAGWVPTRREVIHLSMPGGSSFPVNRYVVSKAGDRQLVLYWFQAHGREVASEYAAKYYLIADSIRLHRSDGALVRLMTPMLKGESPDAAQSRVMQLGTQLLPLLDNSIPR